MLSTFSLQLHGNQGQSQSLFIDADNVESLASFLDDSAVIEERAIKFGSGTKDEKLLEVPLGFIDPHATIRVTHGLDDTAQSAPAEDHDPRIGISDGSTVKEILIDDVNNYENYAPCIPLAASHDDNRVSERTHAPAQATLIFRPLHKYGACYLPLDGGYLNTATFSGQLDTGRGLSLTVYRSDPKEQYRFYSFIVEIY